MLHSTIGLWCGGGGGWGRGAWGATLLYKSIDYDRNNFASNNERSCCILSSCPQFRINTLNPIHHEGGGSKCPDQFLFVIAIFFSRKHAIKLFDFS